MEQGVYLQLVKRENWRPSVKEFSQHNPKIHEDGTKLKGGARRMLGLLAYSKNPVH